MSGIQTYIFWALFYITETATLCIFEKNIEYYSSSFFDDLMCFPGYAEIYEEIQGSSKLVGEPVFKEETYSDPEVIFWGGLSGHIVLEKMDSEKIVFVTNQHLVIRDFTWIVILGFSWFAVHIYIVRNFLKKCGSFLLELVIISPIAFIYLCYLSPLMGYGPTNFRTISPELNKCTIIDLPPFGVEFSLNGLWEMNHFTLLNDWIRLSCPLSSVRFIKKQQKQTLRTFSQKNEKELGFTHIADESWWIKRQYDIKLIRQMDEIKLKSHYDFYDRKKQECVDKTCWWSGNVVSETKYYYSINLTMLPGHSGLSCRSKYNESDYLGIVQFFHYGKGVNICSKLSMEESTIFWIIMPFWPIIMIIYIEFWKYLNLKNIAKVYKEIYKTFIVLFVCISLYRLKELVYL